MKIKCLNKNRGYNGSILSYTLQDETGRVFEATKNQICFAMMTKQHTFIDLQIDKLGRLIYKSSNESVCQKMDPTSEKEFLKGLLHNKDIQATMNKLLRNLKKHGEAYIMMYQGSQSTLWASACEDDDTNYRLVEQMIKNDTIDRFVPALSYIFDKFLLNKRNNNSSYNPHNTYKLHLKSKDGEIEEVIYYNGLSKVNYNLYDTIHPKKEFKGDGIRAKYGYNPKYYNPNNYVIQLVKLDEPSIPIKLYVSPNMSLICPVQFAEKHLTKQPI